MTPINKFTPCSTAIKTLYCCLISFCLFCTGQKSGYYLYKNYDKTILIIVPNSWIFQGNLDKLKKFDPNLSYIGLDANNGCFIDEKEVVNIKNPGIRYYMENELSSVKAKNPGARIISIHIDSMQNSVIINYRNNNLNKGFYFSHAVFMRSTRHVILNFKGFDNFAFRAETDKIIKSVVVKSKANVSKHRTY